MQLDSAPEPLGWQALLDTAESEDWRRRGSRDLDDLLKEVLREVDAILDAVLSGDAPKDKTPKEWHEFMKRFYLLTHRQLIPAVGSLTREDESGQPESGKLLPWLQKVKNATVAAHVSLDAYGKKPTSRSRKAAIRDVERLWTELAARAPPEPELREPPGNSRT